MREYKKSTTLSPLQAKLVKGYAEHLGTTQSKVIAQAVKRQFESMSVQERQRVLSKAEK